MKAPLILDEKHIQNSAELLFNKCLLKTILVANGTDHNMHHIRSLRDNPIY